MKRLIIILALCSSQTMAQTRSSAHYSISADTVNAAGTQSTSAHYSATSSAGNIAAVATSNGEVSKSGYLGQLYDLTGLALTATAANVNENGTRQLAPMLTLDDATFIAVPPALGAWSVLSGPADVSATGLASGETVPTSTLATVRVSYLGFMADLNLTVLNVNTDDYGTYAADGLADDWQVQYFGEDNPLAAPLLDPDHDGFTNLFEFTAGIIPNSASSGFHHRIESVLGEPLQKRIIFRPRLADRTYVIESSTTLGAAANWQPITTFTLSDTADERTITDTAATGGARFYRVSIVR